MVRIVKPRVPGLTYTSLRQHVNPMVDDTFRNIYDNLVYLRTKILESVEPTTQTPIGQLLKLTTKPVTNISTTTPVMVDTHLVRTTTYTSALPPSGTTFYEYDRNAFYIVARNLAGITDWRLVVAVMEDVIGNRPVDLGVADNGFIFLEVPTHKFYVWDNPTWFELRATALFQYGLYSARPAITVADNGLAYYATDQNTLYIVEAGAWVWLAGIMAGTISPDQRPVLVAGDSGFLFWSTDQLRLYIWSGTVWYVIGNPTLLRIATKVADYPLTSTDDVILANATITVTLPTAVGISGKVYTIKRIYALGNTTIATTGGQTIDGSTPLILASVYDAVSVISDNANWHLI